MASAIVPVRGMRDFLPTEKGRRERAIAAIRLTFSRFGYQEIETPAIEDLTRLASGQGGDNEKMIFAILRRGLDPEQQISPNEAADLGLRYDLTLPLARFVASNAASLNDVSRLMQIAPVWRAERPQRGRFRQFTQCDIDIIGEGSSLAEVELIIATNSALAALGIVGSYVRLNDREVLYGILENCGFERESFDRALIVVDKLDKIGVDGIVKELALKLAVGEEQVSSLRTLLDRFNDLSERGNFEAVAALLPSTVPKAALDRMFEIRDAVVAADAQADIRFDITLVRGMGYYTGPIFEIGHPSTTSSIAGGGRYDNMIGRFAKTAVPACGFSIGFERILDLINLPDEEDSRLALMYDESDDLGAIAALELKFVRAGYFVRLVKRSKRGSSQLAKLYNEGFRFHANVADGEEQLADSVKPLFAERATKELM